MKVVFHDILNVKPSLGEYVDKVKEETQSDKNTICVIPSPDYASEIQQAAESDIIVNAHRINAGEEISLDNKSKDFFCLKRDDSHGVLEVMLRRSYQSWRSLDETSQGVIRQRRIAYFQGQG